MSAEGMTVRTARAEDAAAVAAMWADMARQHSQYDSTRWGFVEDAEAGWREHFRTMLANESNVMLVAAGPGGELAGFLIGVTGMANPLMRVRCRGEVHDMYVCREFRGQGVGRKLLAEAVRRMKARGAAYVTLLVASANEEATGFYKATGLRPVAHQMFMTL
jgi:ribosomal protein S18 acetylase RimI-like enzyme